MIGLTAFTVFALGLRHGADPDHLAAIDNLTRNTLTTKPRLSRYVGTLFALGHSAMILAIAALAGLLGTRFSVHHQIIELVGTIISISVLLLIAGMNFMQLRSGNGNRIVGPKTRFLPKQLSSSKNPLIAIPIGLLFGIGFETSSQIATYALAFGTNGGLLGAIIVGALFSAGMLVTDTLDSILVYRLASFHQPNSATAAHTARVWISVVTALALFAAAYELVGLFGITLPVDDLVISCGFIAVVLGTFVYLFRHTRTASAAPLTDAVSAKTRVHV